MTLAVCIATGASLTKEDAEYCRGKARIYVVKDAVRYAPFADVVYSGDYDWYQYWHGLPDFDGEKWLCGEPDSGIAWKVAQQYGLRLITPDNKAALSFGPQIIATGGNSGFQAMNLAMLQGATKIILLGYDMQPTEGRRNFYTGEDKRPKRSSNYELFKAAFERAAPLVPVPVINCSRNTALECFPKMRLQHAI